MSECVMNLVRDDLLGEREEFAIFDGFSCGLLFSFKICLKIQKILPMLVRLVIIHN